MTLNEQYVEVRQRSVDLCQPLELEDYLVQPYSYVSPPKWHLAHTSWFFDALLLCPYLKDWCKNDDWHFLFNSYYESLGQRLERSQRGGLSRPLLRDVFLYRSQVDEGVAGFFSKASLNVEQENIIQWGIEHEQQHQELLMMDILSILSQGPCNTAYETHKASLYQPKNLEFYACPEGLYAFGDTGSDFAFDNEQPEHKRYLSSHLMANRLVSNLEYLKFMQDGGYKKSTLWLQDGWQWVQQQEIDKPLYWFLNQGEFKQKTLQGHQDLDPHAPVMHLSYYEADAFARWYGARLPTEFELEKVLKNIDLSKGQFLKSEKHYPQQRFDEKSKFQDALGCLWQWTSSDYNSYPGYQAPQAHLLEYNGKFMCNQKVLRGGSFTTPQNHYRHSYRNFFYPHDRWAFCAIRLAKDGQ